jgi:hypothetical protein
MPYKLGRKQGLDLEILCAGDERLFNKFGVFQFFLRSVFKMERK